MKTYAVSEIVGLGFRVDAIKARTLPSSSRSKPEWPKPVRCFAPGVSCHEHGKNNKIVKDEGLSYHNKETILFT